MKPRVHHLIGILVKDDGKETAIPYQLDGSGIVLGSLLLVPGGVQGLQVEEDLRKQGLRVAALHPQFPPDEMEYLRDLASMGIRKRVEEIHKMLDGDVKLRGSQCRRILDEARWIKDVLAYYWPHEAGDEVKRVNDLTDVLISRLFELSKPQVLEVVRIED